METPLSREQIENLAERLEAFAAGLDDHERDIMGYLLEAVKGEGDLNYDDGKGEHSTPVAAVLARALANVKEVRPGFSIQYFPWIRHKSPIFDDTIVVKPSN
jgi:hypothetical protein